MALGWWNLKSETISNYRNFNVQNKNIATDFRYGLYVSQIARMEHILEAKEISHFQGLLFIFFGTKKASEPRALSLISELVYGANPSFRDPARFSFSHGGKDGHPYPVDKNSYDFSIEFLKKCINNAKINNQEKKEAFRRLSTF